MSIDLIHVAMSVDLFGRLMGYLLNSKLEFLEAFQELGMDCLDALYVADVDGKLLIVSLK